jgi:AraC-like DNA-binding protein
MQGLLRSVQAGIAQAGPAAVPVGSAGFREIAPAPPATRRTWRGFARELADVLCVQCTGAGLPMQARDELAIVLSRSSARLIDPRGRCSTVGPDDVGIARPGEMYRIDAPSDGGELRVLLVAPEMLAASGPEGGAIPPGEPPRFRSPVAHDPLLAARLHAVFDELRRGLTAHDALARFREALAQLAARHLAGPPAEAAHRAHPGAARAHAYLREHFADPVSLDALVKVSRLSRFYLLRVFRREYGVTPHEYQRHLRLARACRLLAAGSPPTRTAYEAGFSDQSHLTRLLKELTGLTPGAYARQWTGTGREPAGPRRVTARSSRAPGLRAAN